MVPSCLRRAMRSGLKGRAFSAGAMRYGTKHSLFPSDFDQA